MKKKITIFFLLCSLVLNLIPFSAFATEKNVQEDIGKQQKYFGFVYDDNGNKANDLEITIEKITKNKNVISYIEAIIKENNTIWEFKSNGCNKYKQTLFFPGEFQCISNDKKGQKHDGEIAIIKNFHHISGTINDPERTTAFVAGQEVPTLQKIKSEYKKYNELLEKETSLVQLTSTDPNIRLAKTSNSNINMHVIGKQSLSSSANGEWYSLRSWLKTYTSDFYIPRYENNYVTPTAYATGGWTVIDVSEGSASSVIPISISFGYLNLPSLSVSFDAQPTSYRSGSGTSYVKNYNYFGLPRNKVFWPGSWDVNQTGLGARFRIEMNGGATSGTYYAGTAKTEWKIWSEFNHSYVVVSDSGQFTIKAL